MSDSSVQPQAVADPPPAESDFSWRKIRIATVCVLGVAFGSSFPLAFGMTWLLLPLTRQFHWTRAEFSGASFFVFAASASTMPIFGWFSDRVGVRPMLIASAVAVGVVSLALSAQQGSLPLFYIGYALVGALGGGAILYGKVIAALFGKHRGKALAVFGAESTLAYATVPFISNLLLHSFGWRGIYMGFAVIVFAVIPLIYFVIEEPGVVGGLPKLGQPREKKADKIAAPALDGMSLSEALRDHNFWVLIMAMMSSTVIYLGLNVHMVALVTEKGFSPTLAAAAISSTMVIGLGGALAGGTLADHFQSPKVTIPFFLLLAVGAFCMMTVTAQRGGIPLLFATIAIIGIAVSAQQPMATYFLTRYFGLKAFNAINATRTAIAAGLMSMSAPVVGIIYDKTHSYHLAFVVLISGCLFGAALMLLAGRFRYAIDVGHAAAPEKTGVSPPPGAAPAPAE